MHTPARHLAVLTVASLLLTLLAPSAAQASLGVEDPGGGGPVEGGGPSGSGYVICRANGDAWWVAAGERPPGVLWMYAPNARCNGGTDTGNRSYSGYNFLPAGWEVWRFYGTDTTVRGYTVNRSGTLRWGDPSQVMIASPHPEDRAGVAGAPWRSGGVRTNPHGERYSVNDVNRVTTNPPFFRSRTRCDRLASRPDPFAANFSAYRETFMANYQTLVSRGGTEGWSATLAAHYMNMRPGSLAYGDGIPCTSVAEYATAVAGGVPVFDGLAIGYCAIPLMRGAYLYADGSYSVRARWGTSYSDSYGPQSDFPHWRAVIASEVRNRRVQDRAYYNQLARDPLIPRAPGWSRVDPEPEVQPNNARASANAAAQYARCQLADALGGFDLPAADPQVVISVDTPSVFQVGFDASGARDFRVSATHTPLLCPEAGGACPDEFAPMPVQRRSGQLTTRHLTRLDYRLTLTFPGLVRCVTSNPAEPCDYRVVNRGTSTPQSGPTTGTFYVPSGGGYDRRSYAPPSQPEVRTLPAGEYRNGAARSAAASNYIRNQEIFFEFYSATNPDEDAQVEVTSYSGEYAVYKWGTRTIGFYCRSSSWPSGGSLPPADGGELGSDPYNRHPANRIWSDVPVREIRNPQYPLLSPEPTIEESPSCSAVKIDEEELAQRVPIPSTRIEVTGERTGDDGVPVIGVNQR